MVGAVVAAAMHSTLEQLLQVLSTTEPPSPCYDCSSENEHVDNHNKADDLLHPLSPVSSTSSQDHNNDNNSSS